LILRGFPPSSGGERGIRTPDRLLTYTRFPGVRLKPLIHLSAGAADYSKLRTLQGTPAADAELTHIKSKRSMIDALFLGS
jgi:hypothetical protein